MFGTYAHSVLADHCRHVGILSIQGSQFQIGEIPLKTVRPFEMDEVVLKDMAEVEEHKINLEDKDTITAFLRGQVSPALAIETRLILSTRWRS